MRTHADPRGQLYNITDLGPYGPAEINARHQVAIKDKLQPSQMLDRTVLSPRPFAGVFGDGAVRPLPGSAELKSAALGINSKGQIVGYGPSDCEDCVAGTQAHVWQDEGGRTLPDLPASSSAPAADGSEAHAINDRGQIVGWSYGMRPRGIWQKAVMWRDGTITNLGPDDRGLSSAAFAINDRGDIAGWAEFSAEAPRNREHAALWSAGTIIDLGTLAGAAGRSVALAINDAGHVVGSSETAGGGKHAFVWKNGVMSDLGTLADDTDSEALSINERGDIIGISFKRLCGDCVPRAALWSNGTAVDLNAQVRSGSGWHLIEAIDIDDEGCIVGRGTFNGEPRYFMLQPQSNSHR